MVDVVVDDDYPVTIVEERGWKIPPFRLSFFLFSFSVFSFFFCTRRRAGAILFCFGRDVRSGLIELTIRQWARRETRGTVRTCGVQSGRLASPLSCIWSVSLY